MIYAPDFLVHPGESLAEALNDRHMTQGELAIRTWISEKHINQIINGKAPITPETAMKLDTVLSIPSEFWNNLQKNYDETFARLEADKTIESEISCFSEFKNCYTELVKNGVLTNNKDTKEKTKQLLSFFGVSSLKSVVTTENLAFRISNNQKIDKETLSWWLRLWVLEYNKEKKTNHINIYDEKKLKSALNTLRDLTKKRWSFWSEIKQILNECWVAIYFMPYFSKTFVNGVVRRIGDNPIIQISPRWKSHDIFWFTLFHEIGHIILHGKKDEFADLRDTESIKENTFIDCDWLDLWHGDKKEIEANDFASNILIPNDLYKNFLSKNIFSDDAIHSFATKIEIDAWIVARRLAKEDKIDRKQANHFRTAIELKKQPTPKI